MATVKRRQRTATPNGNFEPPLTIASCRTTCSRSRVRMPSAPRHHRERRRAELLSLCSFSHNVIARQGADAGATIRPSLRCSAAVQFCVCRRRLAIRPLPLPLPLSLPLSLPLAWLLLWPWPLPLPLHTQCRRSGGVDDQGGDRRAGEAVGDEEGDGQRQRGERGGGEEHDLSVEHRAPRDDARQHVPADLSQPRAEQ